MSYFNRDVMSVLTDEGIGLSNQEMSEYIRVCKAAERASNQYYKTKKDSLSGRRYSVFHTPISDKDQRLTHWLVLPGLNNWGTKNKSVVTKLYVNIETGQKKFVKIRRPEIKSAGMHIVDSIHEEVNNRLLQVPATHYSRYTLTKGTKAYLFQPYRGSQNLRDYVMSAATGSKSIINMLLNSGEILEKLHQRGFLHTDFKPENVVLSDDKTMLSLVDVEWMMTLTDGERGKRSFHGTKTYQHPEWFRISKERFEKGYSVYYSTKNDVYSYVVMAEALLSIAMSRETNHSNQEKIQETWEQMTKWKYRSLDQLPELSAVLREIANLTISEPQLIQDNKIKKSCFKF